MHNFIAHCEIDLNGLISNILHPIVHSVNQTNLIKRKLIAKHLPPFLTIDTMIVAAGGIALTCAIFLTWYIIFN